MKVHNVSFSRLSNWLPDKKIVPEYVTRIKQTKRKREFILSLKMLKGSKCEICGYDKNAGVLNFHHTEKKQFGFNSKDLWKHSFEDLVKEVKKCKLLCANCHQDLHHPHLRK